MKMNWLPVVEEDRSDDLGCASAECGGVPEWYAEAGSVGSHYCSDCKAQIEAQRDTLVHGVGIMRVTGDGAAHVPIDDDVIIIDGNLHVRVLAKIILAAINAEKVDQN